MSAQAWGMLAFFATLLLLAVFMWPTARRLDGGQKYRRNRVPGRDLDPDENRRIKSMPPLQAALAAMFGASAASERDGGESGDAGDFGGGDAGGGDGGSD